MHPEDGSPDPMTRDVSVIHFSDPAEQRHTPIAEDPVDEELQGRWRVPHINFINRRM